MGDISLRGKGAVLKKDPTTPINPVQPKPGRDLTEAYLKKLKKKK
jgi:hypothetical protein